MQVDVLGYYTIQVLRHSSVKHSERMNIYANCTEHFGNLVFL